MLPAARACLSMEPFLVRCAGADCGVPPAQAPPSSVAYHQPDQQEPSAAAQEALLSLGAATRVLARLTSANAALAVGLAQMRLPLGGGACEEEPDLISLAADALDALSALPATAAAPHVREALLTAAGGLHCHCRGFYTNR